MTPPLDVIGDIANPTLTDNTQGNLTWETTADWDGAVESYAVVHDQFGDYPASDIIQLGIPVDTDMDAYWTLHDSTGPVTEEVNGNDGTVNGATLDASGVVNTTSADFSNDDITLFASSDYMKDAPITVFFLVNFDTFQEQMLFQGKKDDYRNSGPRCWNGGGGSEFLFRFYVNNNATAVKTSSSGYVTGEWYVFCFTMDGNGDMEAWIDKTSLGTDSGSTTLGWSDAADPAIIGSRGAAADYLNGRMSNLAVLNTAWTQALQDELVDSLSSGYLTTGTKTFAAPTQPDLANLSYTLNGESITLDVIGSPGTGSEETVSQSLDGSSSYTLSWTNSHTDFRVKINISTATITTSPTFDAVTLTG